MPLRHVAGRPVHDPDEHPAATYLEVLRRPAVWPLMLLGFLASFVGYSQLNVGMPAYARAVGEISTRGLGFAFASNTLVIVLLQLVVLRRIEGHRRTRVIAVMGAALGARLAAARRLRAGARARWAPRCWSPPAPRSSRSARR